MEMARSTKLSVFEDYEKDESLLASGALRKLDYFLSHSWCLVYDEGVQRQECTPHNLHLVLPFSICHL